LEEIGNPHGFPAADQAPGDGLVVFASLGVDKNAMAVKVDNVEGIESPIVLDVSGSQKIGLMNIVEP
jgi:hypothetical protein